MPTDEEYYYKLRGTGSSAGRVQEEKIRNAKAVEKGGGFVPPPFL